jgi:hypothetical protein
MPPNLTANSGARTSADGNPAGAAGTKPATSKAGAVPISHSQHGRKVLCW